MNLYLLNFGAGILRNGGIWLIFEATKNEIIRVPVKGIRTKCKPKSNCTKQEEYDAKNGKLSYGIATGKCACDASDDEITDCLRNIKARENYSPYLPNFYVCWTWAKEAIGLCGLAKCGPSIPKQWEQITGIEQELPNIEAE